MLLARNANWPAGMYSTLAGFVEPGESLEDALSREIAEEVRESDDVGERRAHFVGDVADEGAFDPARGLQRLVALDQGALDAL